MQRKVPYKNLAWFSLGAFWSLISIGLGLFGSADGHGSGFFGYIPMSPFIPLLKVFGDKFILFILLPMIFWGLVFLCAGNKTKRLARISFLILIIIHFIGLIFTKNYFDGLEYIGKSIEFGFPYIIGICTLLTFFFKKPYKGVSPWHVMRL